MSNPNFVVIGSGMAAFGAAYRLHAEGISPVMFDKNSYHGGHTTSFKNESGFIFDMGPHISYTKDPRIQEIFADSVDQKLRDDTDLSEQLLARPLASASGATPPARSAPRHRCQGHQRLRRREECSGTDRPQLRRLAVRELWEDLRRNLPDAVHQEVPPHHG